MANILKATLGISFSERMFRLSSLSGSIVDELLSQRRKKIRSDSFEKISRVDNQSNYYLRLFNKASGIALAVDFDGVTYTHDLYDLNSHFEYNNFFKEFKAIWKILDSRLNFPDIRRIGYVTEQRFNTGNKDSNKVLIDRLTTFKLEGFPAKFNLTYQDRKNAGHGGLPDIRKDDFINIIYSYYDSSSDGEHPDEDSLSLNANLDVQRYYSPFCKGTPFDEIKKLKKEYDDAALRFNQDLSNLGINDVKAA